MSSMSDQEESKIDQLQKENDKLRTENLALKNQIDKKAHEKALILSKKEIEQIIPELEIEHLDHFCDIIDNTLDILNDQIDNQSMVVVIRALNQSSLKLPDDEEFVSHDFAISMIKKCDMLLEKKQISNGDIRRLLSR